MPAMFESLRGKIQNVQHDLSLSIRELALTTSAKTEVRQRFDQVIQPTTSFNYDLDVNLHAGSDIIDYFQSKWIVLHQNTIDNVRQAKEVGDEISQIDTDTKQLRDSTQKLLSELSSLPDIEQQLANIEQEISLTGKLLGRLEDAITDLTKEAQTIEFGQQKSENLLKLDQTVEKRSQDLRTYEAQLFALDEQRRLEIAKKEEKILRERQVVFQQAFEEELQLFKEQRKQSGSAPKIGNSSGGSNDQQSDNLVIMSSLPETSSLPKNDTNLANISLDIGDEEVNALEQFLSE